MDDRAQLQRQHWFSSAFPIGGYAYSHGLEMAAASGDINDGASLAAWISQILHHGAGRNDAILLAQAWRLGKMQPSAIPGPDWEELSALAIALNAAANRRLETMQQGGAFVRLVSAAWPEPALPLTLLLEAGIALPLGVGLAGAVHGHALLPLIAGYLQAFSANLFGAGIRLSLLGQSEAQIHIARNAEPIAKLAALAAESSLSELGGQAFRADLMAMRHETLDGRLFRS